MSRTAALGSSARPSAQHRSAHQSCPRALKQPAGPALGLWRDCLQVRNVVRQQALRQAGTHDPVQRVDDLAYVVDEPRTSGRLGVRVREGATKVLSALGTFGWVRVAGLGFHRQANQVHARLQPARSGGTRGPPPAPTHPGTSVPRFLDVSSPRRTIESVGNGHRDGNDAGLRPQGVFPLWFFLFFPPEALATLNPSQTP